MVTTFKGYTRNGVIEPLEQLSLPDGLEATVTLKTEIPIETEASRRQRFLEQANRAFAALQGDPQTWREELGERTLLEGALADDLE